MHELDGQLSGKVIVVTGGGGMLGRAFSTSIAQAGGTAIVADTDLSQAEAVAEVILQTCPGRARAAKLDITSSESIDQLIEATHQQYGRVDAVVNNAYPRNSNYGRTFEDVTYEDFSENVSMHLGGYFLVSQRFYKYFKRFGSGNIVNISSIYGVVAPRFDIYDETAMTMPVEYAAIKSAIVHLTRYMAKYFFGSGVRVNALSPGGVADGQPDQFLRRYRQYCSTKGMLDRSDLSDPLIFLLSDSSLYMTGHNLVVDDGFTL